MDEKKPESEQAGGEEDTLAQKAIVTHQNQCNQMTTPPTQIAGGSSSSCYLRGQLYPHQDIQQQQLQRQLGKFWETQYEEAEKTSDFNHAFPLARIKKIMKANEDVNKIAAEAPVMLSKACEMFIMELTMRAWVNTEENKRRTLRKSDIASTISMTDFYDFLVETVPKEDTMEREVYVGTPAPKRVNTAEAIQNFPAVQIVPPPPPPHTPHPYYYVPTPSPQHFGAGIPPRMFMETPHFDHPTYIQQPPCPACATRVPQYPVANHLMMENSPDSDDQTEN